MSHQPQNTFTGTVKPIVPRWSQPPVWQVKLPIGTDGQVFSLLKCWMHRPTLTFPNVGIFLSLNNGKGSAFARLDSLDELRSIQAFFAECVKKVEDTLPVLQHELTAIDSTLKQYQMLRQMKEVQDLIPEEPIYKESGHNGEHSTD